ncbi:MAG: bifunctional riboflavin kinase/FAD synthetase [Bacteroidota bacterium]
MKVYRSVEAFEKGHNTIATIGTFDGVHIGHQTILNRIIQLAKRVEGESVLISFYPHPRLVLFPENNPLKLLHTLEERIATLEKLGLDKLLLIPFTKEFSRTPSKAFIRDVLVEGVGIHTIVIGYDHHFGKNRTGGIDELRSFSSQYEYEVEEIPAQSINEANISSTKIRRALESGEVDVANTYLGYNYGFSGTVVHGEKQGRKLGYPTANMEPEEKTKLIPCHGIYLVKVFAEGQEYFGLMNIGKKPTMGEFEQSQEVFIMDFSGDLYDKTIRVEFLRYLRGEKKFNSLDELIAAMNQDKANALEIIKTLS